LPRLHAKGKEHIKNKARNQIEQCEDQEFHS
jgi:hypothetical protein